MAGKERKIVQGDSPADQGVGGSAIATYTVEEQMENLHNIWVSFAASPVTGAANMDGAWVLVAQRTTFAKRALFSAALSNLTDDANQDVIHTYLT